MSDALRTEGFRVPVLPPKKLIGTLDPDFLSERQSELESWLHQLNEYYQMDEAGAKDPQTSSNYRKFLTQMANQPPFPMERSSGKGGGESKEAEEVRTTLCLAFPPRPANTLTLTSRPLPLPPQSSTRTKRSASMTSSWSR